MTISPRGSSTRGRRREPVAILGCGGVGTAVAVGLSRRGYPVASLHSRTRNSARSLQRRLSLSKAPIASDPGRAVRGARIVFLTVPDGEIEPLFRSILAGGAETRGILFLHCSGALSSSVFDAGKERGTLSGSMHPMQSFPDRVGAPERLAGVHWGIEGDREALPRMRRLVRDLGGRTFEVDPRRKALYHMGGVFASNFVVGLAGLAAEALRRSGGGEGVKRLIPLLRGTLDSLEKSGLPGALTGPVARGDGETVRRHLEALRRHWSEGLPLYRELSLRLIPMAEEKGTIDRGTARRLRILLEEKR